MAKRNSQLTELLIVAQDDYLTIVDTSAGQSKRVSVKNLTGLPDFGWTATGEAWTFSSWTAATRIGVITVPSNATTKYTPKNRIRIAQTTGGTKYGIIVLVTATTLTVHFPIGITLNNEAINTPVYSALDSPVGFPTKKTDWLLTYLQSSTVAQNSPVSTTWYNPGTPSLALGPGVWNVRGRAAFQISSGGIELQTALSMSNSTATDDTTVNRDYQISRNVPTLNIHSHEFDVDLAAAGTAYIIFLSPNGNNFDSRGDIATKHRTTIVAVTNYL